MYVSLDKDVMASPNALAYPEVREFVHVSLHGDQVLLQPSREGTEVPTRDLSNHMSFRGALHH